MTKKLLAVSCASLLLLIQPQQLLAQDAIVTDDPASHEHNAAKTEATVARNTIVQDNWEALKTVPVGDEVYVETRNGKRSKGRLRSVTDTTLTLSGNNQPVSFDQPTIKKIYRIVNGGSRAKNTLVGTAIGTGIGVGIVAILLASTGGSDSTGEIVAIGMLVGAGLGAGVGVLSGKGNKKVLIYESK